MRPRLMQRTLRQRSKFELGAAVRRLLELCTGDDTILVRVHRFEARRNKG